MKRYISLALLSILLLFLLKISVFADLVGKVMDSETGKPLDKVVLIDKNNNVIFNTTPNGIFRVKPDTSYHYLIKFFKQGYEIKSLLISSNDITDTLVVGLEPKLVNMPVITIGANLRNKFDEIQSEAYTIQRSEYQKSLGNTLAMTLKNQIGMAMSSMGPAPARPVFRGFGGNRITILNNGINVSDLSATSPDHSLTIDPLTIEKVELVRGPKILLYSLSTPGAAINSQNSYFTIPEKFCNRAIFFGESVNKGYSGMLQTKLPIDKFAFLGNVAYHNSQDIVVANKPLPNTYNKILDVNFIGLAKQEDFMTTFHYENYQNFYGIPGGFVGAHPKGVDIEIYKNVATLNPIFHFHKPWLDNISFFINRNYYHHIEKEKNNSIGAEFVYREYNLKSIFNHNQNELFDNGSYGFGYIYKDFKIGGYVFTPETILNNTYLFAYEEYQLLGFDFQTSLRTEYANFRPQERQTMNNKPQKRDFWAFSGSISILKELNNSISLGVNFSKTSRIPSIEELYSDGPHLAAYSYDIGNSTLKTESGIGTELFGFFKQNSFTFSLSSYFYNYDYYIIPRNTGKLNVQQILPIYRTEGVRATIYGLESQIEMNIFNYFVFKGNITYTLGTILETNTNLPSIPPLRSNLELKFRQNNFSTGLQLEISSKQDKLDDFEEGTDGYFISNIFVQKMIPIDNLLLSLNLSVDNIFDTIYRNHLSRIKSVFPEPGRNFKILIKFDY